MTASRSCKSAPRTRWLSTGHGKARPDIRQPSQIVGQFIEFDAIRRAFVSRFGVKQPAASARFKSASSPAARKSP
jgi:hypothetical protein